MLWAGFTIAAPPIDIRGIAKDAVSGRPIEGLVVTLEGKQLKDTTDQNGEFRLTNMDPARKLGPVRRLYFSADSGFSIQIGDEEEIIAEIINGAGRAVVRSQYNLAPGGWSLRPKNLAPGHYKVHLWTGSQLRALRMPVSPMAREDGPPEWNLAKIPEGDRLAWGPSAVDSLRAEGMEYMPAAVPVSSFTQLRISIQPKRKASTPGTSEGSSE